MKTKIYGFDQAVWGASNTVKYYFATLLERDQEYNKRDHVTKFETTVDLKAANDLVINTRADLSLEKEEQDQNKYLKDKYQ